MASRDRRQQPAVRALGQHFVSPKKVRNSKRKKEKVYLLDPKRCNELRAQLTALINPPPTQPLTEADTTHEWMDVDDHDDTTTLESKDGYLLRPEDHKPEHSSPSTPPKTKWRILPNTASYHLYHKWQRIVPGLVDEYLQYINNTIGKPLNSKCMDEILRSACTCGHLAAKTTSLTCLYFNCKNLISVF